MAKRKFALEKGGPERLVLEWHGIWKNMQVRLDDQLLGEIPDQKALKEGAEFPLPDEGGVLSVRLKTGMQTELQVQRNGEPLPGSDSDPGTQVKTAAGVLGFLAIVNVAVGLIAEIGGVGFLLEMGFGWPALVMGVVLAGLWALVHFKQSRIALGIAIVIWTLDGVAGLLMTLEAGATPGVGGLVFRIFLIVALVKGFLALGEMKKAQGG